MISAILGFKLSSILLTMKPNGRKPSEVVPIPLLMLTSMLIKNGLITPEQIWPYLLKQVQTKVHNSETSVTEIELVDQNPDDIELYHKDYLKILNQRYTSLNRTVLDSVHRAKE